MKKPSINHEAPKSSAWQRPAAKHPIANSRVTVILANGGQYPATFIFPNAWSVVMSDRLMRDSEIQLWRYR